MAGQRKYIEMMKFLFFVLLLLTSNSCDNNTVAKDKKSKILHFTETTGWDHKTRDVSQKMFVELGEALDFEVVHANDSNIFESNELLKTIDVIVFSNTTGEDLLTQKQKENFEKYMNGGGHFIGIHSATDTHRTNWKFYNDLVGAIVQMEPWHTDSHLVATMHHATTSKLLQGIPNPWTKEEEYYYWDLNGGKIDSGKINTLLKVESTGPESYDRERPTAWYQELPNGTKSFYTSLGHSTWNYEDPKNDFRKLIKNALNWTLESKDQKN